MKWRKFTAVCFSAVLAAGLLAGCGNKEENGGAQSDSQSSASVSSGGRIGGRNLREAGSFRYGIQDRSSAADSARCSGSGQQGIL